MDRQPLGQSINLAEAKHRSIRRPSPICSAVPTSSSVAPEGCDGPHRSPRRSRGTSKEFKHPRDFDPAEEARFEVHLAVGEDADAFEAKLETACWVCSELKSEDADDIKSVLELSDAGQSTREIGRKLSMSKFRVDRLLKKAKWIKKAAPAEPACGTAGHLLDGRPNFSEFPRITGAVEVYERPMFSGKSLRNYVCFYGGGKFGRIYISGPFRNPGGRGQDERCRN